MQIRWRGVVAALALTALGAAIGGAAGAGTPSAFPDVGPAHPFRAEIARFAEAGISGGYSDGTYRPGAPVTRQAMAAFLVRGLGSVATSHRNGAGPFGAATGRSTLNQRPSTLPWTTGSTQWVIVRGVVDWSTEATRATVCPSTGPGCGFQLAIVENGSTVRATANTRISGDWAGGTAVVEAVFAVAGTDGFDPWLTIEASPGVSAASLHVLQSRLTVQTLPFELAPGAPS